MDILSLCFSGLCFLSTIKPALRSYLPLCISASYTSDMVLSLAIYFAASISIFFFVLFFFFVLALSITQTPPFVSSCSSARAGATGSSLVNNKRRMLQRSGGRVSNRNANQAKAFLTDTGRFNEPFHFPLAFLSSRVAFLRSWVDKILIFLEQLCERAQKKKEERLLLVQLREDDKGLRGGVEGRRRRRWRTATCPDRLRSRKEGRSRQNGRTENRTERRVRSSTAAAASTWRHGARCSRGQSHRCPLSLLEMPSESVEKVRREA